MSGSNSHADWGSGGNAQSGASGDGAPTIGVGGPTSGEAGSTPTHETMAETGGSGGRALTQPKTAEEAPLAQGSGQPSDIGSRPAAGQGADDEAPEGAGTAATATARGFQDTRSSQAGRGETGLGTPETGGNQDEGDLAPPRRT